MDCFACLSTRIIHLRFCRQVSVSIFPLSLFLHILISKHRELLKTSNGIFNNSFFMF
jgi:hypothetical protein